MRGFILAAGLGTRLLPITRIVPKALVPLVDRVLADYALELVKQAGVTEIGINAHHLAEQVQHYGISRELTVFTEAEILGTGGYLRALGTFFDEEMLVVNADAVFFGDPGFWQRMMNRHKSGNALVTLLLKRRPDSMGATGINAENGLVTAIGAGDFFFTGCQIVSPEILPMVREASIVPVYRELLEAGRLGAEIFQGTWFDCGTRAELLAAHRYVSGQENFIYPGAIVETGATLRNSVVYPDGIVRAGAVLDDSILFKGELAGGEQRQGGILA